MRILVHRHGTNLERFDRGSLGIHHRLGSRLFLRRLIHNAKQLLGPAPLLGSLLGRLLGFLDALAPLLIEKGRLAVLILLVLFHERVQLLLCVLLLRNQVRLGIPRRPLPHFRTVNIVILVGILEFLGAYLGLLFVPGYGAHLEPANARLEIILGVKLFLQLGLFLEQKVIPGIPNLCLGEFLLLCTDKGVILFEYRIHLDTALSAQVRHLCLSLLIKRICPFIQVPVHKGYPVRQKLFEALDLPVDFIGLEKSLKKEEVLLFKDTLGANETDQGILLSANGIVFIQIIFDHVLGHSVFRIHNMDL